VPATVDLLNAARLHGHRHPHRHDHGGVGRRQFLGLAAGGAALLAAGPLSGPVRARPNVVQPKPLEGGVGPFHVYGVSYKDGGPPAVYEQSTITDFKGTFASTDVFGWGENQDGRKLWFRCDMRLMEGIYVGVDEAVHHGTFGFI